MSTSGKTPSADTRNRPSRVAPRRHVQSVEPAGTNVYDSAEFPVLLRMPDVSRPLPAPSLPERKVHATTESVRETVSEHTVENASVPKAENHRVRHTRQEPGSGKTFAGTSRDKRSTAAANARFWLTIPPQVASGGMLLAVIALCFVLLRGSNNATPPIEPKDEWSSGGLQATTQDMADAPDNVAPLTASEKITERHPERPSVATKPAAPISEPTPAKLKPEAAADSLPEGWPPLPAAETSPTTPIQGWPNDVAEPAQDEGTMLNSPLGAARQNSQPAARMSLRETRPQTIPMMSPPRIGDMPRLNGTIEIPPSTQVYRQ